MTGLALGRLRAVLGGRFANAVLWGAGALFVGRGLHIGGMIAAARVLGPEQFGELTIVYATFAALDSVLLGLSVTATKFVAEFKETDPDRTGRAIALVSTMALGTGLLLASALGGLAPEVASYLLANPVLESSVRLASALVFLSIWFQTQNGVLMGLGAFRALAFTNLLMGVVVFAGISLGAVSAGVAGALTGLVVGTLVGAVASWIAVHREARQQAVPLPWRFSRNELPMLWTFSLPAIVEGLLWWPVTWLASLLLVRQPDGYVQLGLYGAAYQWFAALSFVPLAVNRVLLAFMAERIGRAGDRDAIRLLKQALAGLALVILPVTLLVAVASPAIMRLYGPGFAEGWVVLATLSLAAAANTFFGPLANLLAASDRMWTRSALTLTWAVTLLIGVHILIAWGAIGLALAFALATLVRTSLAGVAVAARMVGPHNPKER